MPAPAGKLKTLTGLCSEATFGKGKKAVNDPSYRKALALATDKFFTNFDLSAHDILTTIKTAMMPDAASVTAQLYKLNIYRPGDFFKSHVDTPRGDGMFGSLVVCLPQPHTGGALLVRHKGQEQRFDFAAASANTVQWAAFYSDCEHEILPVETGHRVTLTYNLYRPMSKKAEGPGLPGLDVDNLSLYKTVADAVADPQFMVQGGELAFGCEYAYPHTDQGLCAELHTMLKGRDALCFKVLSQLGLKPAVKAVTDWSKVMWDCEDGYGSDSEEGNEGDGSGSEVGREDEEVQEEGKGEGEEGQVDLKLKLHEPAAAKDLGCCFGEYEYGVQKGNTTKDRVMWIDRSDNKQLQWFAASYGNEPSTVGLYSSAAIAAFIPGWTDAKRKALAKKLAKVQPAEGKRKNAPASLSGGKGGKAKRRRG